MLRCRQNSHEKFMKLRKDVMEKLELLDQKHGLYILQLQVILYRVDLKSYKIDNAL